jgi:hypothetical protein
VTLNSEDDFTPAVQISESMGGGAGGRGDEPIEVDTLFTRPPGKIVTRQTTVVRQGDKILSIMKPRLREWNVATDIHDDPELLD